jgi:hypothetical protein
MVNYVQRARDVRLLVHQEGLEKGLLKAVERLAEDNEMLRQEMLQTQKVVDKMADIVANIATVGAKLKHEWTEVRKRFHETVPPEDMQ